MNEIFIFWAGSVANRRLSHRYLCQKEKGYKNTTEERVANKRSSGKPKPGLTNLQEYIVLDGGRRRLTPVAKKKTNLIT